MKCGCHAVSKIMLVGVRFVAGIWPGCFCLSMGLCDWLLVGAYS